LRQSTFLPDCCILSQLSIIDGAANIVVNMISYEIQSFSPKDPPTTAELTNSSRSSSTVSSELRASASMCHHCFDVLIHELHKKEQGSNNSTSLQNSPHWDALSELLNREAKPDFVDQIPPGELECPLFITWDKEQRPHHNHNGNHLPKKFELRGCIGTHAPKPLHPSIGEYAILSAFKDKRFQPVSLSELPLLRVAVSLLIRYEPCEHCHDWTVGLHGIIITLIEDSRGGREYSATYAFGKGTHALSYHG